MRGNVLQHDGELLLFVNKGKRNPEKVVITPSLTYVELIEHLIGYMLNPMGFDNDYAGTLEMIDPEILRQVEKIRKLPVGYFSLQAMNERARQAKADADREAYELMQKEMEVLERRSFARAVRLLYRRFNFGPECLKGYQSQFASYPQVPIATARVGARGTKIPSEPGVYFVWDRDRVVYVGKSINLKQRINGSHENIADGEEVSWLHFDIDQVLIAEAFYIGICKPVRNFGNRLKKQTDQVVEESPCSLVTE